MSIYSGFSTRQTEQSYNNLLLKAISLVQNKLLQFINKLDVDISIFSYKFMRIVRKLKQFEQRKYLPPKFSAGFEQLIAKFQINMKQEPDNNNSINLTEKSNRTRKQSVITKRKQQSNIKKQINTRQIAPIEIPMKYRINYNSQTNKRISKKQKLSLDESSSRNYNLKKNMHNNDAYHKSIQQNQYFQKNHENSVHQIIKSPITQSDSSKYYNTLNKQQIGQKGFLKYKDLNYNIKSRDLKKSFLETIKQRIRTEQNSKQTMFQQQV